MDFYGIYTPVITPHHEDGSIDEAGFAEVIEHLIHEGVHGIIIAGTTGEYYAQTMEERMRLLSLGVEIIKGRVPVIGGTGAMRTEDLHLTCQSGKISRCRCTTDCHTSLFCANGARKCPSCACR